MNCPVCREPMIVLELDQVEVDHCLSCKGVWLDQGELELILKSAARKDRLLSSFEIERYSKEKARKCPICMRKMEKFLCGEKNSVRIDRCPKLDGLWFDVRELEQLADSAGFAGNSEVAQLLKDMFGKTMGTTEQGGIR